MIFKSNGAGARMKVMLISNQPAGTTRLKRYETTLRADGHSIVIPNFSSTNWNTVSKELVDQIKKESPDVLHLLNVPDIIYRKIPSLKGKYYHSLIYDYRSPWGVIMGLRYGKLFTSFFEGYEKKLAEAADIIITVNGPLKEKLIKYGFSKTYTIPNYPLRSFVDRGLRVEPIKKDSRKVVLFVGRLCPEEGVRNLRELIEEKRDYVLWIVGDGPDRSKLPLDNENVKFFGWQSNDSLQEYIMAADVCIAPYNKNDLSCFLTDKSLMKINEYLNLGRTTLATGMIAEENRKNLRVTDPENVSKAISECLDGEPKKMANEDYRLWETHCEDVVKEVYRKLAV
jgi:glycosyltransferase involved in cell wall biosynthesis